MNFKTYALSLSLLFSLPVIAAGDCNAPQDKQFLNLTYPAKANLKRPVDVQFRLEQDLLMVDFEVRTPDINAKKELGDKEYPFQKDVVELFISVSGSESKLPYIEFQLSPYGNSFEVRIDDLKKPFINGIDMGVKYEAVLTKTGWKGSMTIPLRNLEWNGNPASIVGNAFSILGKSPNRSFWSLNLPAQIKPSFHKPEYFKALLKCVSGN